MSKAFEAGCVLAVVLVATTAGAAAAPSTITIGERLFPESVTSTRDGTLFVGSIVEGGIRRAARCGRSDALDRTRSTRHALDLRRAGR